MPRASSTGQLLFPVVGWGCSTTYIGKGVGWLFCATHVLFMGNGSPPRRSFSSIGKSKVYTREFPLIPIKGSCTFVNAFGPYVATFCRKHIDRGPKTRKWKETAERSVAQPLDQWFLVTKCGFWPTICSKGAQMF